MILTFLDENIKKCNKFKNENDLISNLKLGHGQNDIYILRVLMLAQRQENQDKWFYMKWKQQELSPSFHKWP